MYKIQYKGEFFAYTLREVIKMENNKNSKKKDNIKEFPERDHTPRSDAPEAKAAINNPQRNLPAYNPPVPNRAWTAMRQDLASSNVIEDFTCPTPEEQAEIINRGMRD